MNPRRRHLLLGLIGAAPGAMASAAGEGVVEVDMRDYQYRPQALQVKVGTTVRWTNSERRTTHSIRFLGPDGQESERLFPGESWQRRFDRVGHYPYVCGPHPEMKGQIDVVP